MEKDSIRYDSLNRPLPKWLIDQKAGLNTIQPTKIIIRDDRSLEKSFAITTLLIIVIIAILTLIVSKKKKNTT